MTDENYTSHSINLFDGEGTAQKMLATEYVRNVVISNQNI